MPSSLEIEVDIPVIDMSQFPLDCEEGGGLDKLQNHPMVATVREACIEWGFFRVVNSGIPTDLLQSVENISEELFAMPAEAKERATTSNPPESYSRSSLKESFCILKLPHSDSVKELSYKIWPEKGNQKFCETIGTYTFAMADFQQKISKLILASLGLDVKTFYRSDFQDCLAYMGLLHYFSNGKSTEEEEALFAHTDLTCFTILYQVEGGLQVRSSEGKWLNIKPISASFIVNVGDCLKAWSNRRFRSAEHRVVYKGWKDRLSVPWFVHFPYDKEIWAPEELVDDYHPRRYRPFIYSQFRHDFYSNLRSTEHNLAAFLDSYAGVCFDD
ncbi:hypothetical protein SUGI_0851760 [Cryptomeria japonica]|uniref:probable 2-oxoglutarate-dependent dioxygenase AOP1 n=1 Tax=Cryptomeria japonica TaxID=3369 RepID=UPI0024147998|nr:probable 2-oxoglutarate-dependent dioxygenase AOP1 [Cryptomeria japonica]GLJ41119.1 hypothetical protein SUGI_0851760 [Cryptomeria japonica]